MSKLTPAQRKALQWVRDHEPVGNFPIAEVNFTMVKKLRSMGLLEEAGRERRGIFGFTLYQLNDRGREALS